MAISKESLQITLNKFKAKTSQPGLSEITKASYAIMISQLEKRIKEYDEGSKQ